MVTKEIKLEKIFEFIRNGANIKNEKSGNGIPITRIETISNQEIDFSKMGYANIESEKYSDYYLKSGDILMSHINSQKHIGKTALFNTDEKVIHGMNLLCLRPNELVLPEYIYYYFKSKDFNNKIQKITKPSVNQASFTVNNLKDLTLFYHEDKCDQERIASEISKIDKAIENRKSQLEDIENIIVSNFNKFIKEYFEESIEISELITDTKNIKMQDKEIEYIDISSIDNKINRIVSTTKYNLKDAPSRARQIIHKGDILYSGVRPNLKNVAILDFEKDNLIGTTGFIVLRSNERILPEFLYLHLISEKFTNKMISKTVGASYPAVSKKDVVSEKIEIIPKKKQEEFVNWFKLMDNQKDNILSDLNDLNQLKESTLIKYFN